MFDSSFTRKYFLLGTIVPEFKSTSNLNIRSLWAFLTRLARSSFCRMNLIWRENRECVSKMQS